MDFTEYDFTECDISDNIDELNSKNFESLRTRYLIFQVMIIFL